MWFKYPQDKNTFALEYQFFFGDSILVSPVTEENATSVSIYLPQDVFYEFDTLSAVKGTGSSVTLSDVPFTKIPLHIKGGAILPLRAQSAMTTTALRKKDFEFIVAPDVHGEASGSLYIDDGESIKPDSSTDVKLEFKNGKLEMRGDFGFKPDGVNGVKISLVRFLGVESKPDRVEVNGDHLRDGDDGSGPGFSYDSTKKVLDVVIDLPFEDDITVKYF